jgi:hypothetical protein
VLITVTKNLSEKKMGSRGKKSFAESGVIKRMNISAVNRPEPPAHLTDDQAAEWRAVVDRLPAEWFPSETHALLAQFCRHVTSARHIAGLIEKLAQSDEFSLILFDRLLRMQEREGRAMSSLATRMRISQQSRFSHRKRTGPRIPAPWR